MMHNHIVNPPKDYTVDHVNRLPLDNRRDNLRLANSVQQSLNRGVRSDSKIPFKGVSKTSDANTFRVRIQTSSGRTHIGCYETAEEAALAYDQAVLDYWSNIPDDPISGSYTQFLYLNFPEKHNGTIA